MRSTTSFDYDAIVIGSGFGGSVSTLRLAEKGYSVCLMERGKDYPFNSFPRRLTDFQDAFWEPEKHLYGLYEFLDFPDSDIVTALASGLGGGSLVYSAVLYPMKPSFFSGWPGGITRQVLQPYYDRAASMLGANPYPFESDPFYGDTPKTRKMKDAVPQLPQTQDMTCKPYGEFPPLGISFNGPFPGAQFNNESGRVQSRCTSCGECMLGCNIHSKNSLDLNYLARAVNPALMGPGSVAASIMTGTKATGIEPVDGGGYSVTFAQMAKDGNLINGTLRAKAVVLACGSYGTTGLLLKMKKSGKLPGLSPMVGQKWSPNGDYEAMIMNCKDDIIPTKGPVITYSIGYDYKDEPDGFPVGNYIEDGGLPPPMAWYAMGKIPSMGTFFEVLEIIKNWFLSLIGLRKGINFGDEFYRLFNNDKLITKCMVLLGMGHDRSTGKIELDRAGQPIIKFRTDSNEANIKRQKAEAKALANALGGDLIFNPLHYVGKAITVHGVGGCVMGDSVETGVVDPDGNVFGYPGLYIADGSVFPTSVGPNPSFTIAAVAERIAEKITIK